MAAGGWTGGSSHTLPAQQSGHTSPWSRPLCCPPRCLTLRARPSASSPGSAPRRPGQALYFSPSRSRSPSPSLSPLAQLLCSCSRHSLYATPWRLGCSCPKSTRLPTCAPRPATTRTPPSWRRARRRSPGFAVPGGPTPGQRSFSSVYSGIRVANSPVAIKHVEKDRISDWGELVSILEGATPRDGWSGVPCDPPAP